jgi:hypothetical protein
MSCCFPLLVDFPLSGSCNNSLINISGADQKRTKGPVYRRKQQAIVRDPIPRWVYLITTQLINSRQGSHGPLQTRPSIQAQSKDTLTIGNTNVSFLIYRDLNHDGFKFITTQFHTSPFFKIILIINYPITILSHNHLEI